MIVLINSVLCGPSRICCSLDPLPTWIIKKLKHVFAPILCSLCNSSLSNGVMPASQKHAIMLPRLKKPTMDPSSLSSYWHISIISFLWKLVERVVTACFISHVEKNQLFPERQSSYRRDHSTETAVLSVHNDLAHAIDKQRITGLVMSARNFSHPTFSLRQISQCSPGCRWMAFRLQRGNVLC